MAGVEDEDEFKDALGSADPPPSSPSPTSKPKTAAGGGGGGGGLGRRLLASIPLPATLSAAIGRFSNPKPPALNVGLGLLLQPGPAPSADGSPAYYDDAAGSALHLPPTADLQGRRGEDQVAGHGAGVGEETGLVPAEEQERPTAEGLRGECAVAVDGCSVKRNGFSLVGQEAEQCAGDELWGAVDGGAAWEQDVALEQEGATEGCLAVVEDHSNNAAVEKCTGDEIVAVMDDDAEEFQEVIDQEGAVGILGAVEDATTVGSQEEEVVVMVEQGEGGISVQDQHELVEQCTGDQLTTITDDSAAPDQEVVEQEGAPYCCAAVEAVDQCTNDGSRMVVDGSTVEENGRTVEQDAFVLYVTKDGVTMEPQEDVVVAEQGEGAISIQHQHDMVQHHTSDQLRTAKDDNEVQGQEVVEQEVETKYCTAVEPAEQCINDGSRAVKDGNVMEENERVVEQEIAVWLLEAAADGVAVEFQEDDDVVAEEQGEDGISGQDQNEVVEQCTGDQLKAIDDSTAQDQEVVEQEGATKFCTIVETAEQCNHDGSRALNDANVVEEKERAMEQEDAVGVLDASEGYATVESQEEYVVVAELGEDISQQDQQKMVDQCTSHQLNTTADDITAQDQELVKQEVATMYYTVVEAVKQCTDDGSRTVKDGNAVQDEMAVQQGGAFAMLDAAKNVITVELQREEDVVVVERGEEYISVQNQQKMVEQCTSDQLRTTTNDKGAEGQEVLEQEGAIVERGLIGDGIAVEDQEKKAVQSAGEESKATKDEDGMEDNDKVMDLVDIIDKQSLIKDSSGMESQEEDNVMVAEQDGDGIYVPDEGNVVEWCTSDKRTTTMDDIATEGQGVLEQEGAIVETGVTAYGISVEDEEKELQQSAGDESKETEDENAVEDNLKVVQGDGIDKQDAIKDGGNVESQQAEYVMVTEQYGDVISVQDEGNVVEQCTSDQLIKTTGDNAAEEQVVVDQEGAFSILGAANDGVTVESQELDMVVAEKVKDDIVVEQCTIDNDNSVQDQDKVVEQWTSDNDNAMQDQGKVVEQWISDNDNAMQNQGKVVEQCTRDQVRTIVDDDAAEDQEVIREKIRLSAEYQQKPSKPNCRFYMSSGSCIHGRFCHFNHVQLKAKTEGSSFPSEQRNHEIEFLELNRVGLPIREGARNCTYYMRNGICRYGKRCCFNHPEQVLDVQLHTPTGWEDANVKGWEDGNVNFQSSLHSKKSPEHGALDDTSSSSEFLPPNILQMLLPPQNVPPRAEEKEMKTKKDPDWSSASDDSDGCCSADSSDGPLCKQEHVGYPKRHGREECPFLLKYGNCKFPSSCKYDHPEDKFRSRYHPQDKFPSRYHPQDKFPSRYHSQDKFPSRYHPQDKFSGRYRPTKESSLAEEQVLYPDKPDEPECPFYMKTGSCKFGADCKFHHPKDLTTGMQGPAIPKRSVTANEQDPAARTTIKEHMYRQQQFPERPGQPYCRYYMQFGKCKFLSACVFNHPKDRLPSGWHPAECPFYMKTGTCQFGPACEFYHPKDRRSSTGGTIDDGTDHEHDRFTKSEDVLQQQKHTMYPERPGELECSHYMKHGECKFQMSCIYHHPTDRLPKK